MLYQDNVMVISYLFRGKKHLIYKKRCFCRVLQRKKTSWMPGAY